MKTPSRLARGSALRGYLIVLSGTLFWSQTGIFIKILLTRYEMEPLSLAFWRVSIIAVFLWLAIAALKPQLLRISRRHLYLFLLYGLLGVAIHQIIWITSVNYNGAAIATVLNYTSPAIVAVLAWKFLREPFDRAKFFALMLTLTGVVLVARAYDLRQFQLNPIGLVAGLGTGIAFAAYSLLGRLATRNYSAWTAMLYAFVFGALFLLPLNFFSRDFFPLRAMPDGWLVLLFLALVPTLVGFGSFTIGLSYLPASVVSLLNAIEPVLTALAAFIVFGETLDALQIFGAGMILISVILLRPRSKNVIASEAKQSPNATLGIASPKSGSQ
ncbi:MAG: EamA family transporter [Chloroflexi bacterium]|nr:EamA family transporter [Chloroflexota bacterium]